MKKKKQEEEIEGDFDDEGMIDEDLELPEEPKPKAKKQPKAKPEVESEEDLKQQEAEIKAKLNKIEFDRKKSKFFEMAPNMLMNLQEKVTELEIKIETLETHFKLLVNK